MVLVKTRKHRQRHCLELDAISDFQDSKFSSFQLLSAQISKLFL